MIHTPPLSSCASLALSIEAPKRLELHPARGFSLLEILIAQALALVVIGAAVSAWGLHQGHQHRLDKQLQADLALQGAGQQIAALLRRAGYADPSSTRAQEQLNPAAPADADASCTAQPAVGMSSDGVYSFQAASGRIALRLSAGAIQVKLGAGTWQALTDPSVLRVTSLEIDTGADRAWRTGCGGTAKPPLVSLRLTARPPTSNGAATSRPVLSWSRWVHLPNAH